MKSPAVWYSVQDTDLLLRIRLQPRSSPEGVAGVHGGRLRIRVGAPPVGGAANVRLIGLLAATLDMPRSAFSLVRGATSRDKDVRVSGAAAQCARVLARLASPEP